MQLLGFSCYDQATLDLGSVDVVFVAAMFLSKVTVFVSVLGLTFLLDHRIKGPARFVEGGLRGRQIHRQSELGRIRAALG